MKKAVKIFGAILLAILYTLVAVLPNNIASNSTGTNKSNVVKESHNPTISAILLSNTPEFEDSVDSLNDVPPNNFEDPRKKSFAHTKITEQRLLNTFTQYTHISRNFLIKYSKSNIIFPFHYFW